MARYALSPEGAEDLKKLAASLKACNENMTETNKKLQRGISAVMDSTGIYGVEIWGLTLRVKDALSDGQESISELVSAILKQVDVMESLFPSSGQSSLGGSASFGGSGSPGGSRGLGGGIPAGGAGSAQKFLGKATNLAQTGETYHDVMWNGKRVQIFDHPQTVAENGIFNQGSNALGLEETCGLCSSGTLMNISGNHFTETDVAKYAKDHHLCGDSGGTSPMDWAKLIHGMTGIETDVVRTGGLDELVGYVENGQGVIIGVEASLYNSSWYGEYDPNDPKGHALFLSSVIRDPDTGEILKYIVIDSNGSSAREAAQLVDPDDLRRAFAARGMFANVTRNILF